MYVPGEFEAALHHDRSRSELCRPARGRSGRGRALAPRAGDRTTTRQPIRIRTLGGFSVTVDGDPLRFGHKIPKRPLALLKGLIALGGDDVPEHRLTDALWSDLDGDFAHDAFTMALHRLRKLLGRREALRLCAGRLGLDRRWCWTDADALDRLELELDSGEVAAEPTSALLSAALDLYRGPFLAADEDDAWTFCRAEHHRQQFVRVVTTCAQRLASADSWQAVLSGCRQAIERESAAEALYQWLMRAALRLDAASEGLAAFGRLRRMLRALEASSPCPESLRLADQLRG